MTNISDKVKKYIDHDAAIKKNLKKGIINQRALAKYILEKLNLDSSLDAVISAIRRYPLEEIKVSEESLIKNFNLSMKNNIFDLSLQNNPRVHKKLNKLPQLIEFNKGEILRIIVGVQSLKVIGDEKNLEKINDIFSRNNIEYLETNLSEITLTFPKKAKEKTGIVSEVTTELTLNNINLTEIMSSAPELILVIDEKDSIKAYDVLKST